MVCAARNFPTILTERLHREIFESSSLFHSSHSSYLFSYNMTYVNSIDFYEIRYFSISSGPQELEPIPESR